MRLTFSPSRLSMAVIPRPVHCARISVFFKTCCIPSHAKVNIKVN